MTVAIDTGNVQSSAANAFLGGNYSVQMSVTCGASANILVVPITSNTGDTVTFTSVQYNSVNLTLLSGSVTTVSGPAILSTAIYYLLNPPTGVAHNLNVIWATGEADPGGVCAIPMFGVNTSAPFGTPALATSAANNTPAVTATGAGASDFYIGAQINGIATSTKSGANQTTQSAINAQGGGANGSTSFDSVPGANPGAFSWTGSGTQWGNGWAAVGVAVLAPPSAPTATIAWIT